VTIDEEISKLDEDIRRLKIEYEAYFNGGMPRPPHDTVVRVELVIKRYSADLGKLNFGQKFKFNSLVQKYALNSELWRRRLKEKEEGRGRFAQQARVLEQIMGDGTTRVVCSDPEMEKEKVEQLLKAVIEAKRRVGERVDNIDPVAFQKFVREKTKLLKESLGCEKVQFNVSVEDGKVKLKAVKAE
jgi:hypothetical protein